jgi:hypothetical protein
MLQIFHERKSQEPKGLSSRVDGSRVASTADGLSVSTQAGLAVAQVPGQSGLGQMSICAVSCCPHQPVSTVQCSMPAPWLESRFRSLNRRGASGADGAWRGSEQPGAPAAGPTPLWYCLGEGVARPALWRTRSRGVGSQ